MLPIQVVCAFLGLLRSQQSQEVHRNEIFCILQSRSFHQCVVEAALVVLIVIVDVISLRNTTVVFPLSNAKENIT